MKVSTGLKGLDKVLNNLLLGDNVVWQIEDIKDYKDFVKFFVDNAIQEGRRVVYMRFAEHQPVVHDKEGIVTYKLNGYSGFESFSTQVNEIIAAEGVGTYYVFDCLSDLLSKWATDLMVGNFFMVTCPYLFELDTVAYFSIMRNYHSFKTVARIRETTQLLIDVYNREDMCCIHPLKVWNRYSQTMFLPHLKEEDKFIPITDSIKTAKFFSGINKQSSDNIKRQLDHWDNIFLEAEDLARSTKEKEKNKMIEKLCSIMITREPRMLALAKKNLTLRDLLDIKTRLIGTGFIGGKAAGMLVAKKILIKDKTLKWKDYREEHDSFYIGSDVFYTYLIQNRLWKQLMEQKQEQNYLSTAKLLQENMLHGKFPIEVIEQFHQIMDYFGQSPIIVRSSSLLEDAFGNAFAGKYESFFLANQGSPEERLKKFTEAVRKIYASTMDEKALQYRTQRGLDKADEQMALLVQRVSGSYQKNYFFPALAGVGLSYNPYVWTNRMDPHAGMLRLVCGLGTRAVNRIENDYARIVALDEPLLRPQTGEGEIREFSQKEVDVIDINQGNFRTVPFMTLVKEGVEMKKELIAVLDYEAMRMLKEIKKINEEYWVVTFDNFLFGNKFCEVMRNILNVLEREYNYPVDVEFTVNFAENNSFRINIVQCRPFQTTEEGKKVDIPKSIQSNKVLFQSEGFFLGGNISKTVSIIIYVNPEKYIELSLSEKYDIARIVGKLNKVVGNVGKDITILFGPGRWGTSTPSLGVPVSFYEIDNMAILGEIAVKRNSIMPDLSFGTHFFQDLVEAGIFYVALFPDNKEVVLNSDWLSSNPNLLIDILPEFSKYSDVIGVYDVRSKNLKVVSDIVSQKVICYTN